jgi:hypothetical protein
MAVPDFNVGEKHVFGWPMDVTPKPVGTRFDAERVVGGINDGVAHQRVGTAVDVDALR